MKLILESNELKDYLLEDKYVDYSNIEIKKLSQKLFKNCVDDIDKIKIAFEYVRDEIDHSAHIKSLRVTRCASEVLKYREGICFAKSMLLAALLRLEGIPTGFCYERILGENKYFLHALNAVYISKYNHWIRVDSRGNTNDKNAQFYPDREQLAYSIREDCGEEEYPIIYVHPPKIITDTLEKYDNCIEMIENGLPDKMN